jgi:nitroreductase
MTGQEVLNLIKSRKSARTTIDSSRPVTTDDLNKILEAATWAPTAHNMQNFKIVAISDKTVLKRLSELKSTIKPEFISENYLNVSFTEEELKRKKTGLLPIGGPDWYSDEARAGKLHPAPAQLGKMISETPVLLLVLYDPNRRAPASEGDFLGVMSLGCMIENMWLMATALGIGLHIVSPLADEPMASEIEKMLNIPANLKITLSCRIGYLKAEETHQLRVRRDIDDFVSWNKYSD